MIIPTYEIRPACHAEGKGLFLTEALKRGSIVVAPDKIDRVYTQAEKDALVPGSPEEEASVRWFENFYTVSTDWPDECYVNHSFNPTGLWHLGFIFALEDLKADTELTVDYRLIVGDGERLPFTDRLTGREIIGLPWNDCLRLTTQRLGELLQ